MKNALFFRSSAIVLIVIFSACTAEVTKLPMNVTLSQSTATLSPGEKLTLTSVITPDEAAIKDLTWSSSDPTVAVVDNGVVTAISEGSAIITVTTNSGNKSDYCKLLVAYPVSSVILDRVPALLTVNQSLKLNATVLPYDAPDKSVTWSSSDPNVAEVVDGVVTAKTPGMAVITVTTNVGARTADFIVKFVPENYMFIFMTMQPSKSLSFSMFGDGEVSIDWGEISAIESSTLSPPYSNSFHRVYDSATLPVSVIIAGENISDFTCITSQISNLDICKCTTLITLNIFNNQLTRLDISNNQALTAINCSNNKITTLDVSNNVALTELNCSMNQLSAEALNTLFNSLHDNYFDDVQKFISPHNNPGTAACDISIALDKGWIVR